MSGPLTHSRRRQRLQELLRDARRAGAKTSDRELAWWQEHTDELLELIAGRLEDMRAAKASPMVAVLGDDLPGSPAGAETDPSPLPAGGPDYRETGCMRCGGLIGPGKCAGPFDACARPEAAPSLHGRAVERVRAGMTPERVEAQAEHDQAKANGYQPDPDGDSVWHALDRADAREPSVVVTCCSCGMPIPAGTRAQHTAAPQLWAHAHCVLLELKAAESGPVSPPLVTLSGPAPEALGCLQGEARQRAVEFAAACTAKPFRARHRGDDPGCEICAQPIKAGQSTRKRPGSSSRRAHHECVEGVLSGAE